MTIVLAQKKIMYNKEYYLAETLMWIVLLQLVDMTPGEIQWLSNQMGHDVPTHKSNYRLHAPAIEITKVGKLLVAIDRGGGKFSGKWLNDVEDVLGDNSAKEQPEPGRSSLMFAYFCSMVICRCQSFAIPLPTDTKFGLGYYIGDISL